MPTRRDLTMTRLDEVMPEAERLAAGCTTVGRWSFAQILWHLARPLERVVAAARAAEAARPTPEQDQARAALFAAGKVPDGLPQPPGIDPPADRDVATEVEHLRRAIAAFQASTGPYPPHPFVGPLDKAGWDHALAIHCAHHFEFCVPTAG